MVAGGAYSIEDELGHLVEVINTDDPEYKETTNTLLAI
jgi:hypothetical protein